MLVSTDTVKKQYFDLIRIYHLKTNLIILLAYQADSSLVSKAIKIDHYLTTVCTARVCSLYTCIQSLYTL